MSADGCCIGLGLLFNRRDDSRIREAKSTEDASGMPRCVVPRPPIWESLDVAPSMYGVRASQRMILRFRRRFARPGPAQRFVSLASMSDLFLGSTLEKLPWRVSAFKRKQAETLTRFWSYEACGDWAQIHAEHFDWWLFPIDDGSKPEFNVTCQEDVDTLRCDASWIAGYREAVRLCAAAWGWDLLAATRLDPPQLGMGYSGKARKDVRLAKICRSLYLFEEDALLRSMQAFARDVQRVEKQGERFYHKRVILDELLHFDLPRRISPWNRRATCSDLPEEKLKRGITTMIVSKCNRRLSCGDLPEGYCDDRTRSS
eukprot:TRINITY_DN54089_c0_g1_i1.p1 TRINITY_DN54089_c0_g1~~TRINITY_DN54089_c0_g1_i1.p1  ORF type:complete len:324 (-),score=41.28 TRINITY_DN54089_c0_g1_i1:222-1166(-)